MPAPARRRLLTDVAILVVLARPRRRRARCAGSTRRHTPSSCCRPRPVRRDRPAAARGRDGPAAAVVDAAARGARRRRGGDARRCRPSSRTRRPRRPATSRSCRPTCGSGRAQPTQLMDAVRFHAVDVLVLTEVTPGGDRGPRRGEGADSYFPQQAGEARGRRLRGHHGALALPVAARSRPTSAAHPTASPRWPSRSTGSTCACRRLTRRRRSPGRPPSGAPGCVRCRRGRSGRPDRSRILLVGDFNARSAHPGFRPSPTGSTTRSARPAAAGCAPGRMPAAACRRSCSSTTC